jgi:hypothetical protein
VIVRGIWSFVRVLDSITAFVSLYYDESGVVLGGNEKSTCQLAKVFLFHSTIAYSICLQTAFIPKRTPKK